MTVAVGKNIGNRLYVHRSAVDTLPARVQARIRAARVPFAWAVAKWDMGTDAVSLIECADWDEADEPAVGRSFLADTGKVVQPPADPWIYHHKWQFVRPDYAGFDVRESKARSRLWQSLDGVDKSRIGRLSYWQSEVVPQIVGLSCAREQGSLRRNPASGKAKKAAELFSAKHTRLGTSEGSFNQCKQVSEKFYRILCGQGIAATWLQLVGWRGAASKAHPKWKKLPAARWGHYAVAAENSVFDFTMRQFLPDAEFPAVYSTSEIPALWDSEYEIASCGEDPARHPNPANRRERLLASPVSSVNPSKKAKAVKAQPDSDTTQVASTDRTYKRVARKLAPLAKGEFVLDYGAGLGLGADEMVRVLGRGTVDTFEPLPVRWQGRKPVTFTKDTDIPDRKYAVVVCLNVLNVLEPDLRAQVVQSVLRKTADGGMVVVGTRAAGSVQAAKNARKGGERSAVWVEKADCDVYQKGYTQDELLKYLRGQSPGWDWKPAAVCDVGAVGFRKELP